MQPIDRFSLREKLLIYLSNIMSHASAMSTPMYCSSCRVILDVATTSQLSPMHAVTTLAGAGLGALAELRQGRLGHGPPRSGAKNKFYTTAAHSADEHHTEKASSRLVRVRLTAMKAQGSTSPAVSGPPATGAPHTQCPTDGRPTGIHLFRGPTRPCSGRRRPCDPGTQLASCFSQSIRMILKKKLASSLNSSESLLIGIPASSIGKSIQMILNFIPLNCS